ncbi:MAG: aldo/keto reductase [Rubellimicrobium sp.]|nr:aldo/keto reductase [Rubellimicrobium sp.]
MPSAPETPAIIGIGCARITAGSPLRTAERLIAAAFDAGARHFDVAPQYGLGTAEAVLGRALGPNREAVRIATKVGLARPRVSAAHLVLRATLAPLLRPLRARLAPATAPRGPSRADLAAGRLAPALEESLRLLRTDRVDLYLLHMAQPADVTEPLVRALEDLRRAGKVRALGLATGPEDSARILAAWPGIFEAVQYSWSILDPPLPHPPEAPLRITHRALLRALGPLSAWLAADAGRRARISAACGADLGDPRVLARALTGAALAENPGGVVLVSSHAPARLRDHLATARDGAALRLGRDLRAALLHEGTRPEARE